ncbi:hypothetical protein SDJN02_24622, partial [Cucurbita argyrosperma subsp. argyrosperma]
MIYKSKSPQHSLVVIEPISDYCLRFKSIDGEILAIQPAVPASSRKESGRGKQRVPNEVVRNTFAPEDRYLDDKTSAAGINKVTITVVDSQLKGVFF